MDFAKHSLYTLVKTQFDWYGEWDVADKQRRVRTISNDDVSVELSVLTNVTKQKQ